MGRYVYVVVERGPFGPNTYSSSFFVCVHGVETRIKESESNTPGTAAIKNLIHYRGKVRNASEKGSAILRLSHASRMFPKRRGGEKEDEGAYFFFAGFSFLRNPYNGLSAGASSSMAILFFSASIAFCGLVCVSSHQFVRCGHGRPRLAASDTVPRIRFVPTHKHTRERKKDESKKSSCSPITD